MPTDPQRDVEAALDRLDFHERTTLPRLHRRIEDDAETIGRWRGRAEDAEVRARVLEAAMERVQKLATQWAVLRAYGGAAYELRKALDEKPAESAPLVHQDTEQQVNDPAGVDESALAQPQQPTTEEASGRPTHPDGTPYRYAEIAAVGWSHCDGCRTWSQGATPENPHECPMTHIKGPATT